MLVNWSGGCGKAAEPDPTPEKVRAVFHRILVGIFSHKPPKKIVCK